MRPHISRQDKPTTIFYPRVSSCCQVESRSTVKRIFATQEFLESLFIYVDEDSHFGRDIPSAVAHIRIDGRDQSTLLSRSNQFRKESHTLITHSRIFSVFRMSRRSPLTWRRAAHLNSSTAAGRAPICRLRGDLKRYVRKNHTENRYLGTYGFVAEKAPRAAPVGYVAKKSLT